MHPKTYKVLVEAFRCHKVFVKGDDGRHKTMAVREDAQEAVRLGYLMQHDPTDNGKKVFYSIMPKAYLLFKEWEAMGLRVEHHEVKTNFDLYLKITRMVLV